LFDSVIRIVAKAKKIFHRSTRTKNTEVLVSVSSLHEKLYRHRR